MFCKYKNMFGKVDTGIHSYRICNIAIVDVIFTILAAYLIYYFNPTYCFFGILLLLFLASIICHRIFCVRTTIDKILFPYDDESKKGT